MSGTYTLRLWEAAQARNACDAAYDFAKPWLIAGHRLTLTIKPEKRSDAINRLLHSRIRDVSEQLPWPPESGKHQSIDVMKRLLVSAWMRATSRSVTLLPALDGNGIDIVIAHTSKMTNLEISELCEYIMAFGSGHNVEWSATSVGREL